MNRKSQAKRAFTLIELLVMIATIAIPAGMLLAALIKATQKVQLAKGLNICIRLASGLGVALMRPGMALSLAHEPQ